MLPSHKRKALIFLAIAIGAMLILEAGISSITWKGGEPFSWSFPTIELFSGIQVRPFGPTNLLLVLFVAAFISIFLTKEGRRRLLLLIISVAAVTIFLYSAKPKLEEPKEQTGPAPTEAVPTEVVEDTSYYPAPLPEPFEPNTPDWLITTIGVGLALVLAVSLAALLWIALQYRLGRSFSLSQALSQEVQATIDALEAGVDFHDAISRCYAQMSRVLQEERGLIREEDMTPREFKELLVQKDFPVEAIETLTHLFEQVRYGHITPGESGVKAALSSLGAIRDHCQTLKTAGL